MLGYNASPQQSTGLEPYQLMQSCSDSHSAPCYQERLEQPLINFDDPEAATADFLARASLVKERSVMADVVKERTVSDGR